MELYNTIDEMPVYNWFKCIEVKDYKYCLRNIYVAKNEDLAIYKAQFEALYSEFIDTFGISDHLRDIIELQNEIMVYEIDKVLTGDKTLQFDIEMMQLKLADKLKVKQSKANTTKVAIEKYLGFRLNEKEVTVLEYYNYLEAIKEDNGRTTD